MGRSSAFEAVVPLDRSVALYGEAQALFQAGDAAGAGDRLDQALRLRPNFAEALAFGGYLIERSGKLEIAARFYGRALELKADMPVVWANYGKALFRLRQFAGALAAFEAGFALRRADADLCNGRAAALRELGRLEESAEAAALALSLDPSSAEAAVNLGNALHKLSRPAEALAAYERACALRPDYGDAICGTALALRALGRLDEARAAFARAEALGCREAISGRGCLDLMLGDFARGWEGYEARWIAGRSLADALGVRFPWWRGPEQAGRVLVLNDHGLGDTIQFCRYLPRMRKLGVEATFVAPARLHRLLAPSVGARLVDAVPPGESFDAQIALSSLPRAFGTRLQTVPAEIPYLAADPVQAARWRARIGARGFRIGVVWQGNPDPAADRARSFPLAALAPLAAFPNVRLISLQKSDPSLAVDAPFALETLGPDFDAGPDAFVDAAAAMMSLDLVVSCDTSVAHLAGALARPVWIALKNDAEWRWLRDRDDSPWYPRTRLFRQSRAGDWADVFQRMALALKAKRQLRIA